jgi:predicted dehydrogenase
VRAVVRGGGSIGTRHAEVLRALGLDVDLWPVRPRTAGGPGAPGGSDRENSSRYSGADLVVIATDTIRHVSDAIEALDQGASRVLIEKPVAPTAAEAHALAAHPGAGCIGVAAPLRAYEGFRTLVREVGNLPGRLSAAVYCHSWLPDWRPGTDFRRSYSARRDEGGVLRDLVHEIDYACVLFGKPRLAGAALEYDGPLDIASDQAASLVWTADRATVTVRLDYISRPSARGIVVRSASGSARWDVLTSTVTIVDQNGKATTTTHAVDRDRNSHIAAQARAFLRHQRLAEVDGPLRLAEGAPATLDEGIGVVELCDEARAVDSARRRHERSGHD